MLTTEMMNDHEFHPPLPTFHLNNRKKCPVTVQIQPNSDVMVVWGKWPWTLELRLTPVQAKEMCDKIDQAWDRESRYGLPCDAEIGG